MKCPEYLGKQLKLQYTDTTATTTATTAIYYGYKRKQVTRCSGYFMGVYLDSEVWLDLGNWVNHSYLYLGEGGGGSEKCGVSKLYPPPK